MITLNEIIQMGLVFIAGLALGALFFGGLWFTVKKSVSSKNSALWILGSFIFRMGVALSGFYFIAQYGWLKTLICLLGFIIARIIILYFTKRYDAKQIPLKKEVNYEA